MLKRNTCRLATVLCGLLALLSHSGLDIARWLQLAARPFGMALGLLSAIFATQWIHYQKRIDVTSGQYRWPAWVRKLLY